MEARVPPERYPRWVEFMTLGWFGSTRRRMLFSVAGTLGAVALGFLLWIWGGGSWWLFYCIVGLGVALLSALAIRWIDRHGMWR